MTTLTTCPTFIDLRAFAAAAVPAADPFGMGRHLLPLREAPVEVGAIALEPGSGEVEATGGDLWLMAAEGTITLTGPAGETALATGQSCVITAGTAFEWRADAPARLIFMAYTAAPAGSPGITPIDLGADLAPSGAPLAELLVGETPSCRNHTDWRSADGVFTCGVWDSTPYHRRPMRYVHFELMVLLAGSVTFVDETGRAGTFAKGDVFLVEQGASCSWDSREHVAKVYAIYRPVS